MAKGATSLMRALLLLGGFSFAHSSYAEVQWLALEGWYLGGSVGVSSPDASYLDDDVRFDAFVGKEVSDSVDLELGYLHLGEFDNTNVPGSHVKMTGIYSGLRGTYVYDSGVFSYIKLGGLAWKLEANVVGFDDRTGVSPFGAFGLGYQLFNFFSVHLELTHFREIENINTNSVAFGALIDF